jgi:hypothetical protein
MSSNFRTLMVTGTVVVSSILAAFALEGPRPTPATMGYFREDNANVRQDIDNIRLDKEHIRYHKAELKDERAEDDKAGVIEEKKEIKKAKADLKKDKKYKRADKKDLKQDHKLVIRETKKELREAKAERRRSMKEHKVALKKGSDEEVNRTYSSVVAARDRVEREEMALDNQKEGYKDDMAEIRSDEDRADRGESVYYAHVKNGKYNGVTASAERRRIFPDLDDDDDDDEARVTVRTNGNGTSAWFRK